MKALTLLLCSLVLLPSGLGQQPFNLALNVYTFGGERTSKPQPDLSLLDDPEVNAITMVCIPGATRAQLALRHLPNLNSHLEQMLRANLLVEADGRFTLSFPVIQGENRDQLRSTVDPKADELVRHVTKMLDQIHTALPNRPQIAFHLLWSRVMDRMWYPAWAAEKRPGKGPPFVTWAIFPESASSVGTASFDGVLGGGSNSKTWSHRSICNAFHPGEHQRELLLGAWGFQVDPASVIDLQGLGLFDREGRFTGFAYHEGDSIDELLKQLTDQYAMLIRGAFDYGALSKRWRLSEDELWIVLQHELAYSILRSLAAHGNLTMPASLQGLGDPLSCNEVVSVRLVGPPINTSVGK